MEHYKFGIFWMCFRLVISDVYFVMLLEELPLEADLWNVNWDVMYFILMDV